MIYIKIKSDFIKVFTGKGFYLCILLTIVLCFSANIYTDMIKNDQYSAFSALRKFDRAFMITDTSFCAFNVIHRAASGWLTMFIPIISAFAYIPLVCDEYEAKSIRFEIFRTGKKSYHISRFITACFCGGIAVTIGYAIFSIISFFVFPNINEYNISQRDIFFDIMSCNYPDIQNGFIQPMFKILGSVFIYGAAAAAPSITLTAIIRNKYLVICIPFFLKYAIGQTCLKLQSQAIIDYEHIDDRILRLSSIINPDSLVYLQQMGRDKKGVLIYNCVLVLIAFAFYLIIQLRRTDCGE